MNAGQIIVAIISVLSTFAMCLMFVMVMKSDVRSVREALTYLVGEVAAVKLSMKEQTEILMQQNRHEVEIEHLKLQVQGLVDQLGRRNVSDYTGRELPNTRHRHNQEG